MQRVLPFPAAAAVLLGVAAETRAQICYDNDHQCFTFAPEPEEIGAIETGLALRSQKLTISGDIRLRLRAAESRRRYPYNGADQQATRARARLIFQATENAKAFVEFNFSETWAGSASYSDAEVGENFDGVSQAYVEVDDMLGVGDKWRVGRSEYILGNGLILGSCDYLQLPSTFTGAWVSKNFFGHDLEVFGFDDYGPLQFQSANPGAGGMRFFGGTANIAIVEDSVLEAIKPFVLVGSRDGDRPSKDIWYGVGLAGKLPGEFAWSADWAQRAVDQASDINAYNARIERPLDLFGGVLSGASYTYTSSEGAMHVNPADFNSAGLLHQYAGAWRSDLQTNQLGLNFDPGQEIDLDLNLLTLDRRGTAAQLGDFEADVVIGKKLKSGVHLSGGYGIDNDRRQVGFLQMSLFF